MQTCNRKSNLAFLAIVAASLLAVPPEKSQAQEPPEDPENFAWITNTNGITWKREIVSSDLKFERSDKPKIASILVPERARIDYIDIRGCVNLTNIVIQPAQPSPTTIRGPFDSEWDRHLIIDAHNSGLRNIIAPRTMMNSIVFIEFRPIPGYDSITHSGVDRPRDASWIFGWVLSIQWTELEPEPEPAPIEIRTHATANGTEVEVIWREGTLQIADTVAGEYRDHIGSSPLRFPLLSAKDMQFYRIRSGEPPTPQTLGGNR